MAAVVDALWSVHTGARHFALYFFTVVREGETIPMDHKIRSVLVGIPPLKSIAAHKVDVVVKVPAMLGQLVHVL